MPTANTAPAILTFVAPATQCNQHCPGCIIDRLGEPVRHFDLSPSDYARFIEQFLRADVPIVTISFQGYEVTLPQSWPYVEAVLGTSLRYGLRGSFITNGMLLSKWTDRIVALDASRVAISLDGADAAANDPIRGLTGAFDATITSIRKVLQKAPFLADRLAVASCLYSEENARSLLAMPALLRELGIPRWMLGVEYTVVGGRETPARGPDELVDWLGGLCEAAAKEEIVCHISDEFGLITEMAGNTAPELPIARIDNPERIVRLEPNGSVRVGWETTKTWDASFARRWNPATDDAVRLVGMGTAS